MKVLICEYCFRKPRCRESIYNWEFVWQSYICPQCQTKMHQRGENIYTVKGGDYAPFWRKDPRR